MAGETVFSQVLMLIGTSGIAKELLRWEVPIAGEAVPRRGLDSARG